MSEAPYIYKCEVLCWLDGDTVDLMVDLGFGISMKEREIGRASCRERVYVLV